MFVEEQRAAFEDYRRDAEPVQRFDEFDHLSDNRGVPSKVQPICNGEEFSELGGSRLEEA